MSKWSKWFKVQDEFSKFSKIKSKVIAGKSDENVRFSIAIPMYKRIDYLEDALNSAINQDINEAFEIAIFDNELNAGEEKINLINKFISKYDNVIYYQNEENLGMFGNFNRAISMSKGKWVVLLHDDDMLKPNYLSTLANYISDDIGMIAPHPEILDMRELENKKQNSKSSGIMKLFKGLKRITLDDFFHISGVSPICALLNKEKFIASGGYDESLFPSSDMGGVMKLATCAPVYYLPEKLFYYRYDVNESLNEKTSRDFIDDTYGITYELGKYLNYSNKKIKKICDQNVASSITYSLLNNKSELFDEYFSKYNISLKYSKPMYLKYLKLKNGIYVFKRLLRKRK